MTARVWVSTVPIMTSSRMLGRPLSSSWFGLSAGGATLTHKNDVVHARQAWGLSSFKVTTKLDSCTEIVYTSDFTTDKTAGWVIQGGLLNSVSTCGTDSILGGFQDFGKGASATRTVDLGSEGNGVIVAFTLLKIDTWYAAPHHGAVGWGGCWRPQCG